MDILIRIPDKEVPKQQKLVPIDLHFVDGHLTEASGYGFQELPKGHGRLIDAYKVIDTINKEYPSVDRWDIKQWIEGADTIIEADKEGVWAKNLRTEKKRDK